MHEAGALHRVQRLGLAMAGHDNHNGWTSAWGIVSSHWRVWGMNLCSSSTEQDSGWDVNEIDHSCTRLRSGGAGKICRSMPNERYEGRRDCMPLKDYTMRIRISRWHDAFGLLHVMPRKGLLPDVISYNAAISACEKGSVAILAQGHFASRPPVSGGT